LRNLPAGSEMLYWVVYVIRERQHMDRLISALRFVVADKSETWYHGRTVSTTKFDYAWTGKGKDQEGPGFYFSSSREDAASYAYPSGIIIEAKLNIKKLLPKKAKQSDIETLVKNAPDLEYKLANWDENASKALKMSIGAMMADNQPYLQTWADFYMQDGADYLKGLVRLGYSGHEANRDGVTHVIVYDPSVIEITNRQSFDEYKAE